MPGGLGDGINPSTTGTLQGNKPLIFVLIQRARGNLDEEWTVPGEDDFNDVVNQIINDITEADDPALKAYAWSDPKRGVIALKTASMKRLQEFRNAVRAWGTDNDRYQYESYLNDVIVEKYSITCLLYTSPSPRD